MFDTIKRVLSEPLQDAKGRYSHARIISMLVAIAATVFVWKMILTGGMSIPVFIAYLCYGMGSQTMSKFLDVWGGKRISTTDKE